MAKRAQPIEIDETDRIEGFLHPRETFRLVGQDEALARAARAIRSGRPPQGWLLTGPAGIGKATLAYRIARYLLRYGAADAGPDDLSVPADDTVSRRIIARSEPGLKVIKRDIDLKTGKLTTVITVDFVRKLSEFFALATSAGGWRIAIVDSADDMNPNAANALLKILEEPPRRSLLMLLSQAPGKLLPTIRSRCQLLSLRPLDDNVLAAELAHYLPKISEPDRAALVRLASGSLGAALALADDDTLAIAHDAERAVEGAAVPNVPALFALTDRVARTRDRLPVFGDFLVQALEMRILRRAQKDGAKGLRRWTEAWEQVRANFDRANALHLEPRQTIVSSVHAIQIASSR